MLRNSILACAAVAAVAAAANAQSLFVETFPYPNGTLVGQGGWAQVGTTATNPIQVTNNAAVVGNVGQDVGNNFAVNVTSGSVYYGLNVNVTSVTGNGDYFAHLSEDGSTSAFLARLYARPDGTGGIQFGVSSSSTGTGTPPAAAPAVYGAGVAFGNYRVVVRYDIIDGASNDAVTLYVNPISDIEGSNTAYVGTATTGATDVSTTLGLGTFNLRQGNATNGPFVAVDDISVATDFATARTVPVPEPATVLLTATAGLGLAGLVRRRLRA